MEIITLTISDARQVNDKMHALLGKTMVAEGTHGMKASWKSSSIALPSQKCSFRLPRSFQTINYHAWTNNLSTTLRKTFYLLAAHFYFISSYHDSSQFAKDKK